MDVNSLAHTKWECKYHMLAKKIFSLLPTTTESPVLPNLRKRKTPQTATFQTAFSMKKRGNFIPPLFRCWLPQSLLR